MGPLYGLDPGQLDYVGFLYSREAVARELIFKCFHAHQREDRVRSVRQMDFHIVFEAFDEGDVVEFDLLQPVLSFNKNAGQAADRHIQDDLGGMLG